MSKHKYHKRLNPQKEIVMTKHNKTTHTPQPERAATIGAGIDTLLGRMKAVKQQVEAQPSQNPVRVVREQKSALLAQREPPYQRERADAHKLLPPVYRARDFLNSTVWPRLDPTQHRVALAMRLIDQTIGLITRDDVEEISNEIDELNSDRLRGGWEKYLDTRIEGLAHLKSHVEQKYTELEFALSQIFEKDIPLLGKAKRVQAEKAFAFAPKPQSRVVTE